MAFITIRCQGTPTVINLEYVAIITPYNNFEYAKSKNSIENPAQIFMHNDVSGPYFVADESYEEVLFLLSKATDVFSLPTGPEEVI